MAYLWSITGAFSRLCKGELDSESPCNYAFPIDAVNLAFVCCFYLSWLVISLQKRNIAWNQKKDSIPTVVSVCCALACLSYWSVAAWNLIGQAVILDRPSSTSCYIFRGMIWLSAAISLHVVEVKNIKTLVTVWWVVFCLLAMVVNIRTLLGGLAVKVLDIITWPINFALLFCACKSRDIFVPRWPGDLQEPLLSGRTKGSRSELSNASFCSRLIFSWVNPLLCRGYLGPLELDDIPSVVFEDESLVAFQRFSQEWESLVSNKCSHTKENLVVKAVAKAFFKENILVGLFALLKTMSVILVRCFNIPRVYGSNK